MSPRILGCLAFLSAVVAASAQDDKPPVDKAYRNVSPEKLESILKELDISYKKTAGKNDGIYFYNFERGKFKVRLHNYSGQDLWLDALFTDKSSLTEINRWNTKAKFSRAVLIQDKDRETISLESQIDCLGGATDAIVRRFITRFEDELNNFVKFLNQK